MPVYCLFNNVFLLRYAECYSGLKPPLSTSLGRLRIGCARVRVIIDSVTSGGYTIYGVIMALDFQNQMFVDLLSEDGLMIAAR